ncbi:MAG TPA: TMEM165/GDT1 family protein, partial [Actinomycetes bacterium]
MDLAVVATTFALIFPVELPDKTFVASLVLATRYRPALVWVGVSLAFLVQCAVAVTAGGLISLLPSTVVSAAAGLLFLIGAVVLWRGAAQADAEEAEAEEE